MAGEPQGFLDYLKAAFHWRATVPGLGRLPVNYLGLATFVVLGIANPGFWLLGAAAELGYLTWLSSSPRFQALVRGERLLAAKQGWEEQLHTALGRLQAGSQKRYRKLLEQCRTILGIDEALSGGTDDVAGLSGRRTGGLNQMLWIFLRLLASREVLEDTLLRVDPKELEKDVASLESRLANLEEGSALARSLRGTLDIQKRRLENVARAKESLAIVDAELERIESQVVLLREESAISGRATVLSNRLDEVTGALAETNRWIEDNARIFGELGADPIGSAPTDLPELPPTVPPIPEGARK